MNFHLLKGRPSWPDSPPPARMPGNFLARYFPGRQQQESSYMINNGIHHAPSTKMAPIPTHKASAGTVMTNLSSIDEPDTPTDPAQINFFPRSDSQLTSRSWVKRLKAREKILGLLCFLFFLTCVVLLAILLVRHYHSEPEENVCTTKECVATAAKLMESMDFTVDPCKDFFNYACGQWNRKHVIPEDKSTYNTFDQLIDVLDINMRGLLESKVNPETGAIHSLEEAPRDSDAIVKARVLYKSCVNDTHQEMLGDQPLRDVLSSLGGWPILGNAFSDVTLRLEELMATIRGDYDKEVFFKSGVRADDKNSTVNIIQFDQGKFGMPSREYYLLPDHRHHRKAYLRLITDVVKLLGKSGQEAKMQIDEMLAFETKLANVSRPSDERHDTGAMYKKMTIRELQASLPHFDMRLYLKKLIPIPLTDDEPVVVFALDYMKDVFKMVNATNPRTVKNYLVWSLVNDMIPICASSFQKVFSQYQQVIKGVLRQEIQWKKCVKLVNQNLGMAVGALFIKDHFKQQSMDMALEMISNLREAFNELLEENEWMDSRTRQFAKEKANAMNERIGYPEFIVDRNKLNAKYAMLDVDQNFVQNILKLLKYKAYTTMSRLREPIRKDTWDQEPVVINAFYNPNTNDIVFPAGLFQPLFYSQDFPRSLNYGGIGVVIGHEITHGFDDKGRQYDKDGNILPWWDDYTIAAFKNRSQCFIDQYSRFKLEQIDQYVNGRITIGENIADNGGLKQSYRAYKKWEAKNGKEPSLPGIGLSHDQLFFLNYAQIWCGLIRDEEALLKIRTSAHSPGPIRCRGPLSNSRDFAKAYSCPAGTQMNPKHKCSVW